MKKIEKTSLDPPKLNSTDKVKKLIAFLLKERDYTLRQIIEQCEHGGHHIISIVQQAGVARSGWNPMWGSYGPAQGGFKIVEISAFSGRLYEIDQTLEAIYEMWPKLKPQEPKEKSNG